jgi:hypothetical protein
MLDEHNPFVKKLRTPRERLREHPEEDYGNILKKIL